MTDAVRGAPAGLEEAFWRARQEIGIRTEWAPEAVAEAEEVARRGPVEAAREDMTAIDFVTVDPPGSRDLDQALHVSRQGGGWRLRYAIADVGAFVGRGGALEKEAWLRGVTFYAPDAREPLYPPALSHGAASLLPAETRPAIVFDVTLDGRGEPTRTRVVRATVRSRVQLTYEQVRDHVLGGNPALSAEPWAASLPLMRELGEARLARETERGGVSLPLLEQHVEKEAAAALGYELAIEDPNVAEEWNAQLSLLAGHVAGERMLAAGAGLLRVMPPGEEEAMARFRAVAAALGFRWEDGVSYPAFIRGLDLTDPRVPSLLWQAKRTARGADYVALAGERPEHFQHSALALTYAHATAPLRRLADRYVLDLLATLEEGGTATAEETETFAKLAEVMNEADRKDGKLVRRVVDLAEAWTLRGREGETFPAVVLGERNGEVEVQIGDPPVRATATRADGAKAPPLGTAVRVRLTGVDLEKGEIRFSLA